MLELLSSLLADTSQFLLLRSLPLALCGGLEQTCPQLCEAVTFTDAEMPLWHAYTQLFQPGQERWA